MAERGVEVVGGGKSVEAPHPHTAHPNKRLHLTPRHGPGVLTLVIYSVGCCFQLSSRFAAQVSRDPLGSHRKRRVIFAGISFHEGGATMPHQQPSKRSILVLAVSLATSFMMSCSDLGGPGTPIQRIVLGKSIDGIELGYTRAQVEQILGKPEREGYAEGVDRAWRAADYYKRADRYKAVLQVFYLNTEQEEWGPVDYIWASSGYTGRSKEGLGIGSHRSEVMAVLGSPTQVNTDSSSGEIAYWYCINKTTMNFRMFADTIHSIDLGPLTPFSFSPKCD